VLVLGWCLPVGAVPLRVQLEAAECSSATAFFDSVRARTARVTPAAAGESAALLEVRLERSNGGMRGELRLRLEDGSVSTRSVGGASCEAVVEALALTAALALESAPAEPAPAEPAPAEPARASEPQPALLQAPAASASQRDEAPLEPEPSTEQASRFRAELGVQAALARVVAPHLNVGGALSGRVRLERPGRFSPTLGVALLHADNGLFESSRHAAMRLSGASLSLCPLRLRAARLALEPGAHVLGARLQAEGRELSDARSVARSWWGAGALMRGAVSLSSTWQVGAEAGVLAPLVERRFVALPSETSLGATPAVAPFANVGVFYVL
jgi:hypothetical protein